MMMAISAVVQNTAIDRFIISAAFELAAY